MTQEQIDDHNRLCEEAKSDLLSKGFEGAWNREPNRVIWKHAGLDCLMVRHARSLHWCGYVGVKPGHPCYGKSYDEVQSGIWDYEKSDYSSPAVVPDLEVHGGLTYSQSCNEVVCHFTDDPKDETWWLGFDCAHSGDLSPASAYWSRSHGFKSTFEDTYKELDHVKAETERLADQLAKVA